MTGPAIGQELSEWMADSLTQAAYFGVMYTAEEWDGVLSGVRHLERHRDRMQETITALTLRNRELDALLKLSAHAALATRSIS